MHVLLAEDTAVNLMLMRYLLKAFGHTVVESQDGEQALAAMRGERFDVVVMDVQMPGMDGLTAARLAKADPVLSEVPLVAVTAYAMVGDRDMVLAAGFDGYITKPIDPTAFVTQVEAYRRVD